MAYIVFLLDAEAVEVRKGKHWDLVSLLYWKAVLKDLIMFLYLFLFVFALFFWLFTWLLCLLLFCFVGHFK